MAYLPIRDMNPLLLRLHMPLTDFVCHLALRDTVWRVDNGTQDVSYSFQYLVYYIEGFFEYN